MPVFPFLSSLALKGLSAVGEAVGARGVTDGAESAIRSLADRFTDHSQKLTRALHKAADRAWRALEIALAGESWWDRCKGLLASGDHKGFRQQVQAFLDSAPLPEFHGSALLVRREAYQQLRAARKAGLLTTGGIEPKTLAKQTVDLDRFGDPTRSLDAEFSVIARAAAELRTAGYPTLAQFLELRPPQGEPLLVVALRFFFRREVETDEQLFQGLMFSRTEQIAQAQQAGFSGLAEALDQHGDRLEEMLADVQELLAETHSSVLDVQSELQRQSEQMRRLGTEVLRALEQHRLEKRELHHGDSLSIRTDTERQLVKQLVARYRAMPTEERKRMPALLNAVGKLEVVAGDFDSAQRDFQELTGLLPESKARAEAQHNAYLAALERRAWPEALTALREAATLDAERFAPFPLSKFDPERILGAGGFGVAFLCRNRHSGSRVVVKTLRGDTLDRNLNDVFREAQVLEEVNHPAVIRVRDCDFADAGNTRPYLVMDYFQGQTLSEYVEQNGPLPEPEFLPLAQLVAEGLHQAHARDVLHRDVKPANLLIRKDERGRMKGEGKTRPPSDSSFILPNSSFDVRLIDFGLAMRGSAVRASTARSQVDRTVAGESIAGTVDYAAPEQMGKLPGVAVSAASDVYGFAKTCCYALFKTPQPTFQHWQKLPPALAELLGRCLAEHPKDRPAHFGVVLEGLARLHLPQPIPVSPAPVLVPKVIPVLDVLPVNEARPTPRTHDEERKRARELAEKDLWERERELREDERELRERRRERERHRELERREKDKPTPRPQVRATKLKVLLVLFAVALPVTLIILLVSWLGGPWRPSVKTPGRPNPIGREQAPPPEPAKPIAQEDFPKVLEELKTAKDPKASAYAIAPRLVVTPPIEEFRVEVTQRLLPGLDPNHQEPAAGQVAVAQALGRWGTPECVTKLAGLLETWDGNVRAAALEALAKLKLPGTETLMARRLSDSWDRGTAMKALLEFGPAAEPGLLKFLDTGDTEIRKLVCQILAKVGTEMSEPGLTKLLKDPNESLVQQANLALIAIKNRKAIDSP